MFLHLFTKKVSDFELLNELKKNDKLAWKYNFTAREVIDVLYKCVRFVKVESLQSEQLIETIELIKQAKKMSRRKSDYENRSLLNAILTQLYNKK